jgi:glycosyltransferase involved in cell wall biosynthesis
MKIRILEILSGLLPAGAENVVSYLATGFDRSRFETEVGSLYDATPHGLDQRVIDQGIPVRYLGKRRGFDVRMYGRLNRLIETFRPDVIHSHSYVLRYLLGVSGTLRVHTVHNIANAEVGWAGRQAHRYAYARGVRPVAAGDAVATSFARMYGFQPTATILNGIDLARFWKPGAGSDWRRANGFAETDFLIVSTGRLSAQKNPVALAEAIAKIPGVRLLLAGEGALRPALEGRERVHLLGLREDVPEVLAAADMFALASDWEGLPLAVIEAMAAGLPVVATDVGSVAEAVGHGRTGLLVPPRNERALVDALAALINQPGRRRAMGIAGRERARMFDVSAMVDGYESLFTRLLMQKSDPATASLARQKQLSRPC